MNVLQNSASSTQQFHGAYCLLQPNRLASDLKETPSRQEFIHSDTEVSAYSCRRHLDPGQYTLVSSTTAYYIVRRPRCFALQLVL